MPALTTSMSEPLSASRSDSILFSTSTLSSDETLSPRSLSGPLGLERERLGLVAGLDLLAPLAVLLGVLLARRGPSGRRRSCRASTRP